MLLIPLSSCTVDGVAVHNASHNTVMRVLQKAKCYSRPKKLIHLAKVEIL